MATVADAGAISSIYGPFVTGGAVSFEIEPPDATEMARRVSSTLPNHPFLVAAEEGTVVGYAYGSAHRARAAYRWAVETSIYLAPTGQRHGTGRVLYGALVALLRAQGYRRAFAGITLPNHASVGFHEAVGFTPVGTYRRAGWKSGRWHDVGWWQLDIDPSPDAPGEIRTVDELGAPVIAGAFSPQV